jgi:guanylate kinase
MEMMERIIKAHPKESYIFYMDISFEETLRRHDTRKDKVDKRTEEDMHGWFKLASPMNNFDEIIIPENYSQDETIEKIKEITKL